MFWAKSNADKGNEQGKRQHEQTKHNQGALEYLDPPSGIFQRLAVDVNAAPDVPSHVGFGPKPVNSERYEVQQEVDNGESPQSRTGYVFEADRFACTLERICHSCQSATPESVRKHPLLGIK